MPRIHVRLISSAQQSPHPPVRSRSNPSFPAKQPDELLFVGQLFQNKTDNRRRSTAKSLFCWLMKIFLHSSLHLPFSNPFTAPNIKRVMIHSRISPILLFMDMQLTGQFAGASLGSPPPIFSDQFAWLLWLPSNLFPIPRPPQPEIRLTLLTRSLRNFFVDVRLSI